MNFLLRNEQILLFYDRIRISLLFYNLHGFDTLEELEGRALTTNETAGATGYETRCALSNKRDRAAPRRDTTVLPQPVLNGPDCFDPCD